MTTTKVDFAELCFSSSAFSISKPRQDKIYYFYCHNSYQQHFQEYHQYYYVLLKPLLPLILKFSLILLPVQRILLILILQLLLVLLQHLVVWQSLLRLLVLCQLLGLPMMPLRCQTSWLQYPTKSTGYKSPSFQHGSLFPLPTPAAAFFALLSLCLTFNSTTPYLPCTHTHTNATDVPD